MMWGVLLLFVASRNLFMSVDNHLNLGQRRGSAESRLNAQRDIHSSSLVVQMREKSQEHEQVSAGICDDTSAKHHINGQETH